MTVWVVVTDNDSGTQAIVYDSPAKAYKNLLDIIESYVDSKSIDDVVLLASFNNQYEATNWKAFDDLMQTANESELFKCDTLYVDEQKVL